MNKKFDINEALWQRAPIEGKDGILTPLIKQLTETALETEFETHLSNEIRNRKKWQILQDHEEFCRRVRS